MRNLREESKKLCSLLGYELAPVGMHFAARKPEVALGFKKKGGGCVAPMIFTAAKGKTVAFDAESTGYPCSAFYFGYADKIFDGIEQFLSSTETGEIFGRECERFADTPERVGEFLEILKPDKFRQEAIVFKPVWDYSDDERPLTVTFYANPDVMSALVCLINYKHSTSLDRIKTGFASSCISIVTYPVKFLAEGREAAFWGSHDISQRLGLPADLTTLTMPMSMFEEILDIMDESFLQTHMWQDVRKRVLKSNEAGGK